MHTHNRDESAYVCRQAAKEMGLGFAVYRFLRGFDVDAPTSDILRDTTGIGSEHHLVARLFHDGDGDLPPSGYVVGVAPLTHSVSARTVGFHFSPFLQSDHVVDDLRHDSQYEVGIVPGLEMRISRDEVAQISPVTYLFDVSISTLPRALFRLGNDGCDYGLVSRAEGNKMEQFFKRVLGGYAHFRRIGTQQHAESSTNPLISTV